MTNYVKKLRVPYTIIDVGWWYQIMQAKLPSGRTDHAVPRGEKPIPGDGNQPSAIIDLRDIGRYVARIVVDPRTLNKMVFAYNEVMSTNESYSILEKVSGEEVPRKYVSF